MRSTTFFLATTTLLTAAVGAQSWLPPGQRVLDGDDATATLTLSVPFLMPDGSLQPALDVDTNGRVFPAGADTADFSETIAELLGGPTSICPYWDDLVADTDDLSGVYFNSIGGIQIITWNDVRQFGGTNEFTIQLQLLPAGSFFVLYDSRVDADEPLVGLSAGVGNVDPGSSDLSGPVSSGTAPELYEDFDLAPFDLQSTLLVVNPNGSGGYDVTSVPGIPDPTFAFPSVDFAGFGAPRFAMTASPISGGYVVKPGGAFDQAFQQGQPLGLSDDGESGPLALGFSFSFPGGTATSDVEVLANGRVVPANSGEIADFTPTLAEFLNDPVPQIAAFWTDMNPGVGGEVWFHASPGTASVTWAGVPQFQGDLPISFQIRLVADGSFQILMGDTPHNAGSVTTAIRDLLVGFTAGNGAVDPGETDLTAGLPTTTGVTFYEFFDVLGASEAEDFAENMPTLSFSTAPNVGAPLDLEVSNLPASTLNCSLLIGLPAAIDIGALGIAPPGSTALSSGIINIGLPVIGSSTGTVSLPLPNDPTLVGITTVFQALSVSPTTPPVRVTDAFAVTIGG